VVSTQLHNDFPMDRRFFILKVRHSKRK